MNQEEFDRNEFDRILATLKPEDFDGHTEFHRLTPEQKLMWLSQIAVMSWQWRRKNRFGRAIDSVRFPKGLKCGVFERKFIAISKVGEGFDGQGVKGLIGKRLA